MNIITIASNVKQFIIHYYDEETLIESQTIQVLTPNSSGNYIYEIVGNEYIPEKGIMTLINGYFQIIHLQ